MCDAFLDTTLQAQYIKEVIDKLGLIKMEKFCSVKDNEKRMRRQVTDWEKISAKDTSDKGLLSKIDEEPLKLNDKKTTQEYYAMRIEEQKKYKEELTELKNNINSPEYIEEIAREKLDMYLPNERVYIDISK